ncbi:MAG: hypothetical protein KDK30_16140 [Leptospiraceae bacterium]|nr:hypothetical protein [Leptospiraceae bacterium]MCB1322358.1 hypothetical protein [Leptospiraceae bacterium]
MYYTIDPVDGNWNDINFEDLVETISSFDPFNPPAIDDNPFEEWKTLFPQEDADPADENQDPWTIIPKKY